MQKRLEPQAFLSTDLSATPEHILRGFRQRWQVEVSFEEVRAHLGTAWYTKSLPTFVDALALVRRQFWHTRTFHMSCSTTDGVKIPKPLFDCWSSLLCYAA
ncbi:MAG TPA: hypothetical protein VL134_12305 [Leptolyngbya sp.]|nr:hypothetical protein [Leptolyngbya sp.]